VQNGEIVQERLIHPGRDVTIGRSPRSTFTLAQGARRHTLFRARGPGRYQLVFSDEMRGKLSYLGAVATLDQLRERGETDRRRSSFTLPIQRGNRGKVVIGDTTVLFQFVSPPPESRRMLRRRDFRPRLFDRDDPVFVGSLALWSVIGGALMLHALSTPPLVIDSAPALERGFVMLTLPPPDPVEVVPDLPQPIEPELTAQPGPPRIDRVDTTEHTPKEQPEAAAPAAPQTHEQMLAEAQRHAEDRAEVIQKSHLLAGLIGTRGPKNSGRSVPDVFADSDSGFKDLSAALENVGGVKLALGNDTAMRTQTAGGGRGDVSLGALARGGGGTSRLDVVNVSAPRGRAALDPIETAEGESDVAIRKVVRAKQAQARYCYERQLKTNPGLAGRLVAAVHISGGRVTSVELDENATGDAELGACIASKIRRWRFPSEVSATVYLPFILSAD